MVRFGDVWSRISEKVGQELVRWSKLVNSYSVLVVLWFGENLVNIGKVWSRIDEKVGEMPYVN